MYMVEAHKLSKLLVMFGALSWCFVSLCKFDLVAALFGKNSPGTRLIYALVGLSVIYLIIIDQAQLRIAMRERSTAESQKEVSPEIH